VKLPDPFFAQLRSAQVLFIDLPQAIRAQRLVKDYGAADRQLLREAVERIGKRLGPQHTKAALEALEAGDLLHVATASLNYYDKAYRHGASLRAKGSVHVVPIERDDVAATAAHLRTLAHERILRSSHPA
jgi:tRNA 2-selenouridine synthase